MPFKSKKQAAYMFAAERAGKIKPGVAEEFAATTPSIKSLPNRAPKTAKKGKR